MANKGAKEASGGTFRPLTEYELSLVAPLLEAAVLKGYAMTTQLSNLRARLVPQYSDNYGSLEFEFLGNPSDPPPVMAADGRGFDEDGVPIDYLLFIRSQAPHELEVVKADGTPIRRFPLSSEIDWSQVR